MAESAAPRHRGDARAAALALLARREYTAAGLRGLLEKRGFPVPQVARVLHSLRREGLQRDERYAECLFLERTRNAYGPLRIRADLKRQGVAARCIERLFAQGTTDWIALATAALRRHYRCRGDRRAGDAAEYVRRRAFLQRRGFTPEHILAVLGEAAYAPGQEA